MAMIGSTFVDVDRMTTAIDLLERLIGALELREEADPDCPSWLADQEVRRLEHEIVRSLRGTTWQPVPTRRSVPGIEAAGGRG